MLNKDGQRELAYIVRIDGLEGIPGYDRVETAIVGGWHVIVQKNQFKVGDPAIYFEIDSRVPADNPAFAFLEKRHYKIKTLKMCKTISQGLLMHPSDFGWEWEKVWINDEPVLIDQKNQKHYNLNDDSRFLTKELGVIYADEEDNQRKAPSFDKYKKMAQRHPNIFKKSWARWLMKRQWGKDLMFFFFGKVKDKKNGWPNWVSKTDEERLQNMPWILKDPCRWIITEKIDGSSTTFTMKRRGHKFDFYVCSRNVCFDSINKPCYYETNIYWEMAQKYDMFNKMKTMMEQLSDETWITIQGETYGAGVQRRDYSIKDHDFAAFNFITSKQGRWNSLAMQNYLTGEHEIPCVPILDTNFKFKGITVDEMLAKAEGDSLLDHGPREGLVLRSSDGTKSFKVVSNSFLLKYHS